MTREEAERRVLDAMCSFEYVSGREFFRHDMPVLREAFDSLVERGLIKSVYVLSKTGRDVAGRRDHESD